MSTYVFINMDTGEIYTVKDKWYLGAHAQAFKYFGGTPEQSVNMEVLYSIKPDGSRQLDYEKSVLARLADRTQ